MRKNYLSEEFSDACKTLAEDKVDFTFNNFGLRNTVIATATILENSNNIIKAYIGAENTIVSNEIRFVSAFIGCLKRGVRLQVIVSPGVQDELWKKSYCWQYAQEHFDNNPVFVCKTANYDFLTELNTQPKSANFQVGDLCFTIGDNRMFHLGSCENQIFSGVCNFNSIDQRVFFETLFDKNFEKCRTLSL